MTIQGYFDIIIVKVDLSYLGKGIKRAWKRKNNVSFSNTKGLWRSFRIERLRRPKRDYFRLLAGLSSQRGRGVIEEARPCQKAY